MDGESDERIVRTRFWDKVRASAGKVPFLDQAVAAWYAALDPLTPLTAKAAIFGALAYFILPFDAVPDFLVGLGYTDDAAVFLGALKLFAPHVTDAHRERARAALAKLVP